jgi:hypothetical protein
MPDHKIDTLNTIYRRITFNQTENQI